MNRKAYVVMAIEGTPPIVTRLGVYSEPSPTQEGNYVQVVLAEAEGDDFAEAARRVALVAAQRAVHVEGLVRLFRGRELGGAMKVALHQHALLRRGDFTMKAIDAWLRSGEVPT